MNDDGMTDLTDATLTLKFLFLGDLPPAPPYPGCGADLTEDINECSSYNPDVCPPSSSGGSQLPEFLEALSFSGTEPCCIPGLGMYLVRTGECESLGGTAVNALTDVDCSLPQESEPLMLWNRPPP